MNLNIMKLEIVVLIAKYKKVTDVAKAIGVKQPTVTFHMRSLEEQFGVQLFEMRTGKVLLTEAGTTLLHYATKILALSQESYRAMSEYRDMGKGSLSIGASYVPGTYILPELMSRFSEAYPGITFQMFIKPAPVIREMLLSHSIDVGFISSQPFEDPAIRQHRMRDDELVVVCASSHRFSALPLIDAQLISDEPFICHGVDSTTRHMTEQWAARHGVTLRVSMELDSLEAIKRAVMLSKGISFISRIAITEEVNRGQLACLPIPGAAQNRSIYMCYHQDRWMSAQLRALEAITDEFAAREVIYI